MGIILLITGIKIPLYSLLNVQQPGDRQTEMLGLPMNVIAAVVSYDPESIDDEIKEFAYKITPKENWSLFQYGSFNNIKDKLTDNNGNIIKTNKRIIEEYGSKKVLSMMFRCFKNSPKISTIALIELTKYTYTICNDYEPFVLFNPEYRYHSLPYHENIILQNICKGYNNFATKTFPHIFMCLGLMHWILIAVVLAEYKSNKSHFWKKIFFIVPIFCNNFGTTLLLTGNKDSFRFFYYTFLVIPLLLIIIYKKPEVD